MATPSLHSDELVRLMMAMQPPMMPYDVMADMIAPRPRPVIPRFLFIGGPQDGKWRDVEYPKPEIAVAVVPPPRWDPQMDERQPVHFTTELYCRTALAEGVVVYVHESIPSADLLAHLVAGYKGAMENPYGTD